MSFMPWMLLAELWFYRLAHCPDYRQQAIKQLDVLLKKGAKCFFA
jgi:hypothetical protein